MSRFGRKQTFISPHYAHSFPASPVGFHPIQTLNWGPFVPYGNFGYDLSLKRLTTRKWQSTLQSTGANVAVYDLYDAVNDLASEYSWKTTDIRSLKNYSNMSTLAANNSSAYLKTAYWLKLLGLIMANSELDKAAKNNADQGFALGVQAGAASVSSGISSVYKQAYDLATSQITASGRSTSVNMQRVLDELKKGLSSSDVAARVDQAKKDQAAAAAGVAAAQPKPEEAPPKKCEDTLLGKIPGYCESKMVYQIAGYTMAGLIALWGIKKAVKIARGNPIYALRTNPSSAANMGSEPELQIALTSKGRDQEKRLANSAFKRTRSK